MTKRFILLLTLFAAAASANAQRMLDVKSGAFSTILEEPTVDRTIEPTDNGYKVTYEFEKAVLLPDNLFPDCEIWQLNGFTTNNIPEQAAYPYASDSFSVPYGHTAHVNILNEEWVTITSSPAPARHALMLSDTIGYNVDNVLPIKSHGDTWMPTSSVSDNGIRPYKNIGIINIGITPVQFNISNGEARICKTLEYEVTFTPSEASIFRSPSSDMETPYYEDPYLSNATLNWEWERQQTEATPMAIALPPIVAPVPEYLIIAATPYKTAVEDFAKWKRTLGFNVTTAYKPVWTQDEVIDEIINQDNLEYLLLVGNFNQIPADKITYNPTGKPIVTVTDKNYACFELDNIIPEISYGRIPVNNLSEATIALNKIKNYEKNPVFSDDFYKSNLFVSAFLGYKNKASMRNSQTTYEISKYMESLGKNVKRLFKASGSNTNPQTWSDPGYGEDGILYSQCPIPTEMRKPNYNWTVMTSDIVREINKGYGQVFYFAHGDTLQWIEPTLSTTEVTGLTNGSNLPVVFSMACQTNNFSVNGCLSEKFLTSPNGGAVGVFGFTNNTLIGYTDIIASALYNGMYPSPGVYPLINDRLNLISIAPRPDENAYITTELGLLHRLAITKMVNTFPSSSYSNEIKAYEGAMLTLFGDPSMHINLTSPSLFPVPKISVQNGVYTLQASGPFHIITVYNGKTNEVKNYRGQATFSIPSDPSEFVVTLHAPGYKPAIMDFSSSRPLAINKQKSANDIIMEGRTWRYFSPFNGNMKPNSDIYLDLAFSGTTEFDGKEYLNCYVWKETDEFTEENAVLIAYMREEDGKVYARYIPDADEKATEKGIDILPYAPMMASFSHDLNELAKKDVLLFDDSFKLGDTVYSVAGDDSSDKFEIVSEEIVECFGVNRKAWELSKLGIIPEPYNYYEGIGDIFGLLPFPSSTPITYNAYCWTLVEVLDQTGNVLFAPSKMTTGVKDIKDESKVIKETFHTLGGLEVEKPTSSGIYLKTQTFDDGSVRTTKVVVK